MTIENYISSGTVPYIDKWTDWKHAARPRGFQLVDGSLDSIERLFYSLKGPSNQYRNCIVLYTPLDAAKILCAETLIAAIQSSSYSGHVIYQKGGWPNMSEGDLALAHIPGAHKICAIREALRLGYEKVLWLDCDLMPEVSLSMIFAKINNNNVFAYQTNHSLLNLFYGKDYITTFNITAQAARNKFSVYRGVIGLNLEDSTCVNLINSWYSITLNNERYSYTGLSEFTIPSKIMNDYYDTSLFPLKDDHFDASSPSDLEFSLQ